MRIIIKERTKRESNEKYSWLSFRWRPKQLYEQEQYKMENRQKTEKGKKKQKIDAGFCV